MVKKAKKSRPKAAARNSPGAGERGGAAAPHASASAGSRYPEFLPALGAAVRAARAGQGLSQGVLAERAGMSARFIAHLEAGRGNISVGKLSGIARALDLPIADLLSGGAATGGAAPRAGLLQGKPPAETPAPGTGEGRSELFAQISVLLEREPTERLRGLLGQLRSLLRVAPGSAPPPLIALVGLRGAGKSTIGPLLADALGLSFLELDDRIQDLTGLALEEIFELHGERYYRLAEGRALQELVEGGRPAVVAVSGGIVTDPQSFYLLRERTLLVWLKATPHLHMERVRSQGDGRPMRRRPNAMAELNRLLEARSALYGQAPLSIDTSLQAPADAAAALAGEIRRIRLQ